MIVGEKIELTLGLAAPDRERLDRVPELLRRIELLEARAAASAAPAAVDPVFVSAKAFARRWSVSERAVRGWLGDGMPAEHCGARLVRIPVASADAWVRTRSAANPAKKDG